MINAVTGGDIRDGEGIDALKTPHVVPVQVWIGAALVVGVDAAVRAEIVLGGMRIELVELQVLGALEDADAAQRDRGDNGPFAPANGAIAAAWVDDAVWQIEFQLHQAAMTRSPMLGLYLDTTNFLQH